MTAFIQKRKGLLIGILFLLISIGLTYTLIIPLVVSYLGLLLYILIDAITSYFLEGKVLFLVSGILVTLILLGITLVLLWAFKRNIRKRLSQNKSVSFLRIILYMSILVIPIQNVGFFILWSFTLFKPDAQIMFAALVTFPVSGIFFVPVGIYLDYQLKKAISSKI